MARGGFRKNSGPKLDADGKALKPYKRRDGESSESSNGESSNVVQMRAAKAVPAESKAEDGPAIDPRAWAMMLPEIEEISRRYSSKKERTSADNPFQLPAFPKAAVPTDPKLQMAQDSALTANLGFASNQWLAGGDGGFAGEGFMFLGYTYLSELALRPEYRVMAETIADDATRKWIDFDVVGDEKKQQEDREKDPAGYDERMADPAERKKRVDGAGKTDKVKALQDDQLRLAVRDRYYEQARNGGFFGRSHLFHDIRTNSKDSGDDPNLEELKSSIGDGRDAASKSKVPIGSFKALKTIEPMWAYPLMYNAAFPWRQDWYNPQVWYVNGQEFHGSRLLTFIPHPVPDMLKPAYAFGGLSLTQMAKPYVDRWITTVSSVNALIHSFSVMVLATDLSTLMQPGNMAPLMARVAMFNMFRDNQGTFVINNKTEDFKNVSASLAGLHELQAQAQEHMASINRIPLVKFTGIQPSGLNASSEGEIEVYDDTIGAYQARVLDGNLRTTINFEQLSLWGEIDPEITHRWQELRPMTQAERGQKQKDDADTRQKYVDMGSFSPQEIRKIAIEDPELPFGGLDPDDAPEPPAEEGLLGPGAGSAATEFEKEASGQGGESDQGGGASDAVLPFLAGDAEFVESEHPRAPDGKFGSGGGTSAPAGHPHGSTPKFHAMVTKHKIPEAASDVAKSARALKQKQGTVAKYAKYIAVINEKVNEITNSQSDSDQLISLQGIAEAPTPDEINDYARGLVREGKVKDVLGFEDDKEGFKDLMQELSPQEKQDLMMLKGRLEALYPKAFEAAKETRKLALETEKAMKVMRKRIEKSPMYDDFEDQDDVEHLYADRMAMISEDNPEDLDDLIGITSYLADEPISAEYAEILQGQKDDIDESAAERRRFDALSEEEQAKELAEKAEKERLDKAMEDKHRELTIEIAMRDGWKPEFNDIGSVTNRPESVKQVASSPTSIGKMYRFLQKSGVEIPEAGKRFLDW